MKLKKDTESAKDSIRSFIEEELKKKDEVKEVLNRSSFGYIKLYQAIFASYDQQDIDIYVTEEGMDGCMMTIKNSNGYDFDTIKEYFDYNVIGIRANYHYVTNKPVLALMLKK